MPLTTLEGLSLQDLILTLKGDRTYAGLEEASNGVVKAQRWNQITNGIRISEFPEPRTIAAMAEALNVSVDVVLLAFARALGLKVNQTRSLFEELLPPDVAQLSDKQRDAVLAVIRAMIAESAATGDSVTVSDAQGGKVVGSKHNPLPVGKHSPPL
jgi:hypothetical protein